MRRIGLSQQGFAVIAAIFLVVVLAALGGFMLSFSNTQQLTLVQDIQGSRAYWASRAGLDWAISSVNPLLAQNAVCPLSSGSLNGETVQVGGDFTVVVWCTKSEHIESTDTRKIFLFTSVAKSGMASGSAGFIERSLTASIEK